MGAPIVGNSDTPVKLIIPNETSWGDAIPARTRGCSPLGIVCILCEHCVECVRYSLIPILTVDGWSY